MTMESLNAASRNLDNQNPVKQFAIEQARRLLRDADVADPGPRELYIPELSTILFQKIWNQRGETVSMDFEVPACPYTEEELKILESQGRRIGYLPLELSTVSSRNILTKIFPLTDSPHPINYENPSGWFDYDATIDLPNRDTSAGEILDKVRRDNRTLLSLNQYIIAGNDSKLFTGQYLDERWKSNLLAAIVGGTYTIDGSLVASKFSGNGSGELMLRVVNIENQDYPDPMSGGRSAGKPKVV